MGFWRRRRERRDRHCDKDGGSTRTSPRQGSCGGTNFTRGLGSAKKTCGGLTIKTSFSGASFTVGDWTLTVHGNYVYGRISGPQHRLDLAFKARGDAPARSLPHGIVGQVS